jgi:RNA-directed DNA polymerase
MKQHDHAKNGEGGTGSGASEVQQTSLALIETEGLANQHERLMEEIVQRENVEQAIRRVVANKGAPGVDGMTVKELWPYMRANWIGIKKQLMEGTYKPQPIRGVKIPKPEGGERQLGIPTVLDRTIQQAMVQVMEPLFDPEFSESSYGFRRGRSAHDALKRASEYVEEGRGIVVDIDLEKYFDQVNHDVLMAKIGKKIRDKKLLKLVGRFLRAGLMQEGLMEQRVRGTPQGGPLSPLLSNILLDELDKELEKRPHKFCRYADDCNIYVRTEKAGHRVMQSVKAFLEKKLKLKINETKSAVAPVQERKFLGFFLDESGRIRVSQKAKDRMKKRIREITKRNRGVKMEKIIEELNVYLRGWGNYFQMGMWAGRLRDLDSWVRRRLRCYRFAQGKRNLGRARLLISLGIEEHVAWKVAKSAKRCWRLSAHPVVNKAMPNKMFKALGLLSLAELKARS